MILWIIGWGFSVGLLWPDDKRTVSEWIWWGAGLLFLWPVILGLDIQKSRKTNEPD